MLKKADSRSDLPQEKVNTIAFEIAEDRAAFESKIAFARELVADAPQIRTHGVNPDRFREYLFVAQLRKDSGSGTPDRQHPMRLNSYTVQERYTDEVDMRVTDDLVSGLARPTKEEHRVARLSLLPDRSEDEASIAAGQRQRSTPSVQSRRSQPALRQSPLAHALGDGSAEQTSPASRAFAHAHSL